MPNYSILTYCQQLINAFGKKKVSQRGIKINKIVELATQRATQKSSKKFDN
jgi:hypothetical protein